MSPLPATVSVAEASTLLGVSTDALYDACKRDEFATVKVGRRVRVALRPLLDRCGVSDGDARALLGLPVMPRAMPNGDGSHAVGSVTSADEVADVLTPLAHVAGTGRG